MGRAESAQAVALLAATYPGAKFEQQGRADVWIRMLEDLPGDALKAAVTKLICTSTFCPSIAELRTAATAVTSPESSELTAGEAWGEVLSEIGRVGWCGAPRFSSPLIERAVQCTANWRDLCATDLDQMPTHRARFQSSFDGLQRQAHEQRVLPEALRQQIENCRADHLSGALDDARPARLPGGRSEIAREALDAARREYDETTNPGVTT
jgi:hypothetical protein